MLLFTFLILWSIVKAFALPNFATYETVKDAARIARGLLADSAIGTMATRYPPDHPTLPGFPFSLQEYYASCYNNGSLLLLFLPITRHGQNIIHSPEHAASLSVWRSPNPSAAQARVSLIGSVTILHNNTKSENQKVQECYLGAHPDAIGWLPNTPGSHPAFWARFDPAEVYFVGGFGGEHYIGEIPLKIYQEARQDDTKLDISRTLHIQS